MKHLFLFTISVLTLATLITGCPKRSELFDDQLDIQGPVGTNHRVSYLNRTLGQVKILTPQGLDLSFDNIFVGSEPLELISSPQNNYLAVISSEEETLSIIDEGTLEHKVYELGSGFNALSFSEDERFVIAYHSITGGDQGRQRALQNPNEYAVVDLQAGPSDENPVLSTLRSFGSSPYGITYVPEFILNGEPARIAIFLFPSSLAFVNLLGSDSQEVTVHLTLSSSSNSLYPEKILFTEDIPSVEDDMFAFVLTQNSNDIYAINMLAPTDPAQVIQPSLNQITPGIGPQDMALYTDENGNDRLVVVNSVRPELSVVEISTSRVIAIELEHPVNRIFSYQRFNEETEREEPYVLLYQTGGTSKSLDFVRLFNIDRKKGKNVEPGRSEEAVVEIVPTPLPSKVIIQHPQGKGLSILNLEREFVNRLTGNATLDTFVFSDTGNTLYTILNGQPYLGIIDLENSHPNEIELDHPAQNLILLPTQDSIVIDHQDNTGILTLVELSDPSRERASVYEGLFLQGIFDLQGE